jgi:glycosyltransferase involved in cell wall biosynthesis
MKFSIIIPLYNSDYIQVQLKSIEQILSRRDFLEVIFVDDGSERDFLEKYQSLRDSLGSQPIHFFSLSPHKE